MPSPHDYRHLTKRWRLVAQSAGLRMRRLVRVGVHDLFYLQTPALAASGGIYLSAAIHGDEPASSAGLLAWAEQNIARLAELPLLIFPALNPWGLVNNSRLDLDGLDLNRLFHRDDHPVISAVKTVVGDRRFEIALMLHEDYDGEGFYLYEIKRRLPFWGEDFLRIAGEIMPLDQRLKIDKRAARQGLIRRRFHRARFEKMGYPEAIWLHEAHAERALTIETPSESALEQRIAVQIAMIDECVRRVQR